MNIKQLIEQLPEQVRDELLGTMAILLAKQVGAPSPEVLLIDLITTLYPGHTISVFSPEQLKAAIETFEKTGDSKAAKEAVAEVQAKEAISKAARS